MSIDNNHIEIDGSLDNREIGPDTSLVNVIVPVKYSSSATYIVPQQFLHSAVTGSWVEVDFGGRSVKGVVVDAAKPSPKIKYKAITKLLPYTPVSRNEILFWQQLAEYYMCTPGEVLNAAYPGSWFKQEEVRSNKTPQKFLAEAGSVEEIEINSLSGSQEIAYNSIKDAIDARPVLLNGVTGSGKTEIYINLAVETLRQGRQVLFMVPEISLSRQLQMRLKKLFGKRVVTYHSQQTPANRHFVGKLLQYRGADGDNIPLVVLGTRSSLFLPYSNLGLVIVDEEHDSSYKQTEPNPRYNGRDAVLILAKLHNAKIILGSATPSLETLYNVYANKYALVELNQTYYGATAPKITVIDTLKARKTKQMVGNFSRQLINLMKREIEAGGQIMLLRNRRSYSPQIECFDCGTSPVCPHCNVHLSYHKATDTLICHHCEYTRAFSHKCESCGGSDFIYRGTGTERIEEELAVLFPNVSIARYDADSAKSIKYQKETLKAFTEGEIRILVGTQMVSKGFDFPHLSMVVVMQAETMVSLEDFRADERAMQLLRQIMGRTGRREKQGAFVIQTSCADHPVFKTFVKEFEELNINGDKFKEYMLQLLNERKKFDFAPFVRMVKIIIRHKNSAKLTSICADVKNLLINNSQSIQYVELTGPFTPIIDKIRDEYIKCFYLKFARNNHLQDGKRALMSLLRGGRGSAVVLIDVDPL